MKGPLINNPQALALRGMKMMTVTCVSLTRWHQSRPTINKIQKNIAINIPWPYTWCEYKKIWNIKNVHHMPLLQP